uniref:Retrotransposon protein, putative, Ty1-copia subclass n=1 Tax=Tanacetum cinerariifolium TaxID=118510 RepID=A0A6L2JZI6_TANCI|nr:hypothetical protein [Tanacetum cinerariifolium]
MLKLHEETLPKKDANPALHAIRAGRVQKNQKNKSHKATKGSHGKGKGKMGNASNNAPFASKPKTPPPPKKDNPVKDAIYHQCGEVGHWRRNCPVYLAELMKKKKLSQGASTSGIFTIELYTFPSKSWIYDTGCGTHICITTQGLRGSKKLKPGALSLYVGDGHRAAVEAIGTYHLELPSILVIILNNCHYAPSITRGVILVSRLFDDGFINHFDDNNVILVSKNNLVYFMAIPRDGIYEINMSCSNTNDSSILSENKVFVARNAEFFESKLLDLKASRSVKDLELIQEEDMNPSVDTSLNHEEDDQEIDEPQSDINPIHKSFRKRRTPDHIRAIRILIAIAVYYDYEIWKIDVKTTFLNGHLSEEVYMEQPEGFVNPKYHNHVCKLKHSIYGLKQASSGSYIAILILYVADILLMGNNIPMLKDVKSYLGRSFAMKDLGEAAYILGIKIYRDRLKRLIGLCQKAYIEKILKRFYKNSKRGTIPMQEKLKLSKSQGASTLAEKKRMQNIPYASVVGSIMYAVRCTRPDVAFAQNMTSRFQQNPGEEHWSAVKNILKYLCNTKDMLLVYGGNMERELKVSCYTDAGYITDADNLKSQTGYAFVLNRGTVDWKSTKQSIFATSSTDAEYIAAFDASKEAVWIRKFISWLGIVPTIEEPISMYCDNTGAIAIAKDDGVTKVARPFRAKVYYLRETIKLRDVKIEKIDTDDNLAEPFIKALAFPKHSELTRNIGLLPASSFMELCV